MYMTVIMLYNRDYYKQIKFQVYNTIQNDLSLLFLYLGNVNIAFNCLCKQLY